MPGYDPESYNVIMLLQNEEQNQLEKIVQLKDSTGRIVTEYKTFPQAQVGEVCLRRTFVYDAFEDVTAETVATDVWTTALESIVNPTATTILGVSLSQLIVPDGAPAGSKIADISTLGGNNPYTYTISSDPSDKFQILGDQLYLKDVADISDTSYDVTILSTDLSGSTFSQGFTLPIEDQTPTDITLSSLVIFDGATSGEIVGTLEATATHNPVTFTITSDPSNKFTITDDNQLTMDATADISDVSYNVTVRAIDSYLGTYDEAFVITVEDVSVKLSSLQITHDSVAGTKVADISGGSVNTPVTFSIVLDADNKFSINDGDKLILKDVVYITDSPYSVTIRGTDSLANTHDEIFSIKVIPREDPVDSGFDGDIGSLLVQVQEGIFAARPGDTFAKKIVDVASSSVTYTGESQDPSAAETSALWRISRLSTSGTKTFTQFAGTGLNDFSQIFSDRDSLFPAIPFDNEFSVQFSGNTDQNASVPDAADLDFVNTDSFSLGMWFKTTDSGASTLYQKTSASGGNNGLTVDLDGSARIDLEFRGSGTGDRIRVRTDSLGGIVLNDGSWHYMLITKASGSAAASTISIYVDGVDQTLNTLNDTLSGTTTNSNALFIASNISGASRFTGNIDEISLWNGELTSLEATEVYNSNSGVIDLSAGSGQISSTLVSWWRMGDGDTFPTIEDNQGTNDMTLGSSVTSGDIETETPP